MSIGEVPNRHLRLKICVGWVERSETHQATGAQNAMGFAALNPSYELAQSASRRRGQRLQRLARAPGLPPRLEPEVARNDPGRHIARAAGDGAAAMGRRAG